MTRKYGKERGKYIRVRVSEKEYDRVMEVCKERKTTATEVLRKALGELVKSGQS